MLEKELLAVSSIGGHLRSLRLDGLPWDILSLCLGNSCPKLCTERLVSMESALTAIEATGTIDEDRRLRLDESLPLAGGNVCE